MFKTNFIFAVCLLCVSSYSLADEEKNKDKPEYNWDCKADREFITTFEYLKKKANFGLKSDDMRKVALQVTKGCTGAAGAFIEVTELLIKSGLDSKTAIEQARDLSIKGELVAKAFVAIFKGAFAKEILDMDSGSAMRLARQFSTDFKGAPEVASDDFLTIAKFCVANKGLDLPRPECAKIAARMASYSEQSRLPVASAFTDAIEYFTKDKSVNLSMKDAISLAESLVAVSPNAFDNFKGSFEYASDKTGMGLGRSDAIEFAKNVAINSKQQKQKL